MNPYEKIAERLLAMTDEAGKWRPCWDRVIGSDIPRNAITGHAYQGMNILSCWSTGYPDQRFATYQQWKAAGAQVRKGETGIPIAFYKQGVKETDEGKKKGYRMARVFWVFNVAQVDGWEDTLADAPELHQWEKHGEADALIAHIGQHARIVATDSCNQPCYMPDGDKVLMPPHYRFHDSPAFYGVLFHELTHWTAKRVERDTSRYHVDKSARAREELVAELGAAFICARLGLDCPERDEQHAAYLATWHRLLKHDPRAFGQAATDAGRAADYLFGLKHPQSMAA